MKDGALKHVLVDPYGIFKILMEANHAQKQPRLKLRIGPAGKTGPYATLGVAKKTIGVIVGKISTEEATREMKNNGAIDISNRTYGYLRGSQLIHEGMDQCLYNDWAQLDLDEMIHVDRLGINVSEKAFIGQVGGCARRYHIQYTRGVIEKGEVWGKLAELQIDKVEVRMEISKKQLWAGDIPDGLRVEIRGELGNINERWESPREEDAKQKKRPLLTSQGRSGIETGTREGTPPLRRYGWLGKNNEEQGGGG